MTVEELRCEAKALGYNIIKINPMEKLLPCVCGCNRREHWYVSGAFDGVKLKCMKCGREANGRNDREVRHNWNQMIKEVMPNEPRRLQADYRKTDYDTKPRKLG